MKSNEIKAFVYDKAILDFYLAQAEFEDKLISFAINSNKEYFSFASGKKEIIHSINPFLVDVIESKEWGTMLKKIWIAGGLEHLQKSRIIKTDSAFF